ncbi:MAG: ATP-binding cassette domain-containing protein, partial [Rothia dentocariosa]|nr:ATP-binding cassette domain-containing protein [Rothia dentocariosa]
MSTTTIAAAAPAVATRNLFKTYGRGEATVHALNNVTIDFERGKFTAIMGPSGSGKSTLMQTLATLDTPDRNPETSIQIGGTELYGQKDNQLTEFRREHVGFIFQAFN